MNTESKGRLGPEQIEGEARRVSHELFGSSDRLRVAAAISAHDGSLVYARELATTLNLPDNVVRRELLKFAAAGILVAHPRVGNQPAYFERLESAFWAMAEAVLREVTDSRHI
jgi:hypothetical protein